MLIDRHRLVQLAAGRWAEVLEAYPEAQAIPTVVGWVDAGFPLIGRRPVCDDDGQGVPLGLPLPPSLGKLRIAICAPAASVLSTSPPPLLSNAVTAAPAHWHATIDMLVGLDGQTRCFGSLAWASLTGLDYLSGSSDLDLLWHVTSEDEAKTLLPEIFAIDAAAPMRLDGEIVTPNGMAVQWREWASNEPEVMVKTIDGTRMTARDALFS